MQGPPTSTEDVIEAPIPIEILSNDPNLNRTVAVRRKAAKRTLPWGLGAGQLNLVSPPQAKDTQATKRPRLETPFPTSTDEATTKNTSHDTVALPHPDADLADSDPVMDINPNARATGRLDVRVNGQQSKTPS
jgi:hypothetical protein